MAKKTNYNIEAAMRRVGAARAYMARAEQGYNFGKPEGGFYLAQAEKELLAAYRLGVDVTEDFRELAQRQRVQQNCRSIIYSPPDRSTPKAA